jgi:signal transduction histidine kinase
MHCAVCGSISCAIRTVTPILPSSLHGKDRMSETPTPPWGIRVEQDLRNEYADGVERLQTRLLHIGLFLLTVVMLGGGAGVLMVATGESNGSGVSVTVVAGCVVAVLVAVLAAMKATRQLTPLARRAARPAPLVPAPRPEPEPEPVVVRQQEPAAPLWSRSDEQVTITDDPGQRREVFVKLARRLQSLINRAIKRIDELEQENEDPELLDGLYEIDHLFTLARRQGENLAVLGGEAPQRRSNKPVSVYAVLLAAVSEAEHYRQIAIVPVEDVEIHGHAVAEIIHLLAELLENATRFTSPDGPKVEVRAQRVRAGLAIEVQDRGLGMSYEDLDRINHLLDGSTHIDLSELLTDGRIGLAVVRELARRHDIRVRLQSNIFGGIAAAVVIPPQLLSEPERESPRHRVQQQRQSVLPQRRSESSSGTLEPVESPAVTQQLKVPALEPVTASAERTSETGTRTPEWPSEPAPSRATESSGRLVPSPVPRRESAATTEADQPAEPIPVPAPLPIPTSTERSTATSSSAGFGPARPGRRHRVDSDELPSLPVRAPGRSYDDLRTGGDGIVVESAEEPPPLPQRRGSHLREELLEPPAPTTPMPGHNTSLMKTFQAGRDNWYSDRDREENTNKGDTWPTT